ncbi:MAG TPA: PfkB family carbohydrate kinase [Candidatus Saccharimonadales bacterium]|nr:PfkB family carbohydrate kinase [Candidatus Saccharimonadales bacterium]
MVSKFISFTTIGDLCIDIYPNHNKVLLGGTAFNVAYHAKKAGADASIISLVGEDRYGDLFIQKAQKQEINTDYLEQVPGKTSSVQIPLDENGKPQFAGWELGVLEHLELTPKHTLFLQNQDAVRAILLKPLQKSFEQFCKLTLPHTLKVGDLAGGSIYSIETDEIERYVEGLDMIIWSVGNGLKSFPIEINHLKQLAKKYNKIVLASLGEKGSMIFTKDREYFEPAIPVDVTDTTGAGDAYIAYFMTNYLQTKDIATSMKIGSKAASEVVEQFGSGASF